MDTHIIIKRALAGETKWVREGLRKRGWQCSFTRIYSWMTYQRDVTRRDPLCQICELLEAIHDVCPRGALFMLAYINDRFHKYATKATPGPAGEALACYVHQHSELVESFAKGEPVEALQLGAYNAIAAGHMFVRALPEPKRLAA